ncbi:MAG: polysaccharide biosynthesis protein [Chlorobi bacterium]|nr:polysaccharide biosynthesis protein [Chlorobiota bacterium]
MEAPRTRPWLYLAIRFFTLAIRFVFVALFFRYSEAVYGEYGLLATTVALGVYVLGLEFYVYAQRELLKGSRSPGRIFGHQLIFYAGAYALLLPFFYLLFKWGFLDVRYLTWFYLLLVAEHLSYEVHRLLFVLEKPLAANINLFFRNGFWMIPLIWKLWRGMPVDMEEILRWWVAGDLLSLVPLAAARGRLGRGGGGLRPDWRWIVRGIRVGLPYFAAVLSFKAVEFSDRYFIDYFYGKEMTGIYTFFGNLAILVNTVVTTTVVSLRYPSLVRAVLDGDAGKICAEISRFVRSLTRWTLWTAAALLPLLPLILRMLGKAVHLQYYHVFVLLVAANVVFNLSLIYHFLLYALHKDRVLTLAAVSGMVLNVAANLWMIPRYGLTGAALTTLAAMGWMAVLKYLAVRPYLRKWKRQIPAGCAKGFLT